MMDMFDQKVKDCDTVGRFLCLQKAAENVGHKLLVVKRPPSCIFPPNNWEFQIIDQESEDGYICESIEQAHYMIMGIHQGKQKEYSPFEIYD